MSQKVKSGSNKGDVSYVRATGPPGSMSMASPPGSRDGSHTPSSQVSGMDNDWDDRDEIRMRELEEARARATQMEKTMRWWSDCTANWREKWSKVRNERNKAREENRQLRAKLEALAKECTVLKRQNNELTNQNEGLKKGLGQEMISDSVKNLEEKNNVSSVQDKETNNSQSGDNSLKEPKNKNSGDAGANISKQNKSDIDDIMNEAEGSLAEDKAALFELKLDEAQKTIFAERGERSMLMKTVEKLQIEYNALKSKYEDLKHTKQETLLEVNKLKDEHKEEMNRLLQEVEDESSNRLSLDKRLGEVRRELEKLQRENADEWGKRERLETEKFALERDNKKLRTQIEDLEEQLERKTQKTSAIVDSDMRTLQIDLSEKTKELNDLRHAHAKVKKTLQEKLTELDHTKRRAEQYEMEVKKLRGRVEELKRDLANAEDEADTQGNMVRKLQRTNEELQEQMENLQVQLNHAQSRLQRSSQPVLKSRTASLKSYDPDDPCNNPDSDDDLDDDDET